MKLGSTAKAARRALAHHPEANSFQDKGPSSAAGFWSFYPGLACINSTRASFLAEYQVKAAGHIRYKDIITFRLLCVGKITKETWFQAAFSRLGFQRNTKAGTDPLFK